MCLWHTRYYNINNIFIPISSFILLIGDTHQCQFDLSSRLDALLAHDIRLLVQDSRFNANILQCLVQLQFNVDVLAQVHVHLAGIRDLGLHMDIRADIHLGLEAVAETAKEGYI